MSLAGWRPALRVARRDLVRHKGRNALVAVMVGLPVLAVSTFATVYETNDISPVEQLNQQLGQTQALVNPAWRGPIDQLPDGSNWQPVPTRPSEARREWTPAGCAAPSAATCSTSPPRAARCGPPRGRLPVHVVAADAASPAARRLQHAALGRVSRATTPRCSSPRGSPTHGFPVGPPDRGLPAGADSADAGTGRRAWSAPDWCPRSTTTRWWWDCPNAPFAQPRGRRRPAHLPAARAGPGELAAGPRAEPARPRGHLPLGRPAPTGRLGVDAQRTRRRSPSTARATPTGPCWSWSCSPSCSRSSCWPGRPSPSGCAAASPARPGRRHRRHGARRPPVGAGPGPDHRRARRGSRCALGIPLAALIVVGGPAGAAADGARTVRRGLGPAAGRGRAGGGRRADGGVLPGPVRRPPGRRRRAGRTARDQVRSRRGLPVLGPRAARRRGRGGAGARHEAGRRVLGGRRHAGDGARRHRADARGGGRRSGGWAAGCRWPCGWPPGTAPASAAGPLRPSRR